jgi:hypothetical protein
MPKLRVLSGREVLKILGGFDRGTLHAIYRQASRFIPESELRGKFFTD